MNLGWRSRLRRAFLRRPAVADDDPVAARGARFRHLYGRFREFLALNDATLELIADIEDTLAGKTPFAFVDISQRILRASRDVQQMVRNLNEISGGRHESLRQALRRIREKIETSLPAIREVVPGPYVMRLTELRATHAGLAGPKMANLGEVWWGIVGPEIPEGFVITAAGFARLMTHNRLWERVDRLEAELAAGGRAVLGEACAEIQGAVAAAEIPPDLQEEILSAYEALAAGGEGRVAVRSSAVDEDGAASHAGQYATLLDVDRPGLLDAYRRVAASAYSPTAVAYRMEQGLSAWTASMAVGCLRMIDPRVSGILFSRDLRRPEEERVTISAVRGSAADLAAGREPALELVVAGFSCSPPPDSCLTEEEAVRLAKAARRIEDYFRKPMDIEWALDDQGNLFILQARPLPAPGKEAARLETEDLGAPPILSGGLCACPGSGSGPVFPLFSEDQLDRFPPGAVLVARHSSPAYSRVMKECAALVTEVGASTGHMAILAREFDVPTIVGLPGALRALTPGQTVTVDASGCRIFDGALPLPPRERRRVPARSEPPSLEALRGLARLVVPLNLTDPAGPDFRPEGCRTLHDVMRYAHERIFGVMFHFGDLAESDRRSALRLAARLPFEVLIYDVGGGLTGEAAASGEVQPEAIASAPLQAFLEGLLDARVHWDQPRPVSTRGFLSVLGESMAGPPAEARSLGRTSYAVVSDRYMNFSTKAGYHFTTVDTYCGASLNKNYIHFRFFGGGAAGDRRSRRVRFLHTVLGALGFRSQPRGDVLVARLEKEERQVIRARLAQLGRLTLVARQLDMLMDTDESPDFFARAFLEDRMDSF